MASEPAPQPAVTTEVEPEQHVVMEISADQRSVKTGASSFELEAMAATGQMQEPDSATAIQLDDSSIEQPVDAVDADLVFASEPGQAAQIETRQQPVQQADPPAADTADYLTAIHFASQLIPSRLDK